MSLTEPNKIKSTVYDFVWELTKNIKAIWLSSSEEENFWLDPRLLLSKEPHKMTEWAKNCNSKIEIGNTLKGP